MSEPDPTGLSNRDTELQPLAGGPDRRDVVVLILGILGGVLLSGAVFGRIAPQTWSELFIGAVEERQKLSSFDEETDRQLSVLRDGQADSALEHSERERALERMPLKARFDQALQEHRTELNGRLNAILFAVLAVLLTAALIGPEHPKLRGRLLTAGYALLAIWLAITIARPAGLGSVSMPFLMLVVVVAFVAALIPLRFPAASADEN